MSKSTLSRSERRERRWNSKKFRAAIVGAAFISSAGIGVVVPSVASAQGCTDTEIRNNMTCRGTTDPRLTKAVLSTAAGAALGAAGGPVGVVVGAAGGAINGVIDFVTGDD